MENRYNNSGAAFHSSTIIIKNVDVCRCLYNYRGGYPYDRCVRYRVYRLCGHSVCFYGHDLHDGHVCSNHLRKSVA